MSWLFGKSKTPQEIIREHQRTLQRSMRELERERVKLEQQEVKLKNDIKKAAKNNQINAAKIMAKDMVRTRRYIQKFHQMHAQLQAVSLRMQTMRSTQSMADAMKGVAKAMRSMNRQINLPGIQKIMQDFERESEIMDMKEEMMNDAIDDAVDDENDEEETEAIVNQVLEEIGINLTQAAGPIPTAVPAKAAPAEAARDDVDAQLQARLENLRK